MAEDYGEVWAGAFWDIRELLGSQPADRLIGETARAFSPQGSGLAEEQRFVDELIQQTKNVEAGKWVQDVRRIFEGRGWVFQSQ
jgi:hypothetical protein